MQDLTQKLRGKAKTRKRKSRKPKKSKKKEEGKGEEDEEEPTEGDLERDAREDLNFLQETKSLGA